MLLVLIIAIVVGSLIAWLELTNAFPKVAAPAPVLDPQEPVRALDEHCSVALCADEVSIHIRAARETWPFCLEHGMPYLVSGKTAA